MKLAAAARVEPSRIRELARLAEARPGTLRLFFGEDTLPTPDFIKRAGRDAIARDRTYYTPNAGYPELREGVARHLHRLRGPAADFDPEAEVVVTASGMTAIQLACQATVGPGDSALVVSPLWPNIAAAIRIAGAEAIEVPLVTHGPRFRVDLDALRAAVRPDTRLIALASPNNPTGWTATDAEWAEIVAFAHEHDLWILADQVYERLSFREPLAPWPLDQPGARARTILVHSFSKSYRMTGWRVGFVAAVEPVARAVTSLQEYAVSHASGIAQEAALVALESGEPFLAESLARYRRHRQVATERLRQLDGVTLEEPEGAFYLFPHLPGVADSFAFCARCVTEYGVGFAPGSAFGTGGEGHIRICFAVDETTLVDALDRLARAWDDHRRGT